jgi:hypothetical protein
MKYYNNVAILFSKYSPGDLRQKELVTWLGSPSQSAIVCKLEKAKKFFLRTLTDTPAIYMS